MNQHIENIIKNALHNYTKFVVTENPEPLERRAKKEEISSLIVDEVLKVVVEKIKEEINKISKPNFTQAIRIPLETHYSNRVAKCNDIYNEKIQEILQLLTNSSTLEGERSEHLSPNKENKNK